MKKEEIAEIKKTHKLHHTSWKKGYLSRKDKNPHIKKYQGRFGKGYTTEHPAWNSTKYHYIIYWIEE